MWHVSALLSALAVLPAVNCIAFGGPAPTAVEPDKALNGFTPKPTRGPSVVELRRRQTNLDPETCGWVDGDYSSGITCSYGRTCMLFTTASIGMAGCCQGSNYEDCGWAYSCVDYSSYSAGGCDSSCEYDDFVRKCTNTRAPYCVTWKYANDPGVLDFGCGDDAFDTLQTIYQEASDGSYTTSMTLPTLTVDDSTSIQLESSTETSDTETTTETDTATDTATETTDTATETETDSISQATDLASNGGTSRKTKKKTSVGLIAGVVVGALVLIGVIAAVVIFLCVKQRKKKQVAASQAAVASAQAGQPQPPFNPNAQPVLMQQPPPPMAQAPVGQPPQQYSGYYAQDQKINPQTQVHEYPMSPNSNPASPAPPYVQPYYAQTPVVPPMPAQSPAPYQAREPTPGTHEVDSISVAQPPTGQQAQPAPAANVYEIGGGK